MQRLVSHCCVSCPCMQQCWDWPGSSGQFRPLSTRASHDDSGCEFPARWAWQPTRADRFALPTAAPVGRCGAKLGTIIDASVPLSVPMDGLCPPLWPWLGCGVVDMGSRLPRMAEGRREGERCTSPSCLVSDNHHSPQSSAPRPGAGAGAGG